MAEVINFEDYNVRTRSGDARLTSVVLTGWGDMNAGVPALKEFTDNGRLWGRFTETSGLVELFRHPAMAAGDRVMSGTAANGEVTLAEDNSSGMTGSMAIDSGTAGDNPAEDSEFDIVVSYAHELDVSAIYAGIEGEMDDGQFNGQDVRLEALLKDVKRETLDPMIWDKHADEIGTDEQGRPNVAWLSSLRQLAKVHALLCVAHLYLRRAGMNPAFLDAAEKYEKLARDKWGATALAFDRAADGEIDRRGIAQNDVERG